MRVWIDLANSPHPLLFRPIAAALQERGAEVSFTVRDHAQTRELALQNWPDAEVIGRESRAGAIAKGAGLAGRVGALARWARRRGIDVALSHNSYAQICAARLAGARVVTAMDYEHQPANHLAFRLAGLILVPEALPPEELTRQGAKARKLVRYPGFKEEVYLADFDPDEQILESLGIDVAAGTQLAVVRAAPAGAAYHRDENPIFERVVRGLDASGRFTVVVLARHPEQRAALTELALERTVIPAAAVDARSLLWEAGLFVGAGGTMSREAALLGTPSLSIFAGRPAAVDIELERRGSLHHFDDAGALLAAAEDAAGPEGARPPARGDRLRELQERGSRIVQTFVTCTLDGVAAGGRR